MTTDPRFARLLKERIGLDAESVGDVVIERAVRQRCNKVSGGNGEHYWMLLQGSTEEVQALIEAVIVPETWFFRYPESFGALADLASRRVLELAGSRPLRVLSLPCSTGEEPYSIVMALLDAGLAPSAFQVDALDVSRAVLERAEEGRYGRNSFRGSSLEFRDRHFSADGNDYQLAEAVRRKVRFRVGNLLAQGLLAGEAPYDYVFCRNLLIYFDQPTQRQVFEVLKRLTHEEGVLFIGPAEGSLLGRLGMRSIGIPQSFAFSRHHEPEPAPVALPQPLPLPVPVRSVVPPAPRPRPFARRPVAAPLSDGARMESDAASLLATIAALANEGKSAEARAACERYLQQHEPVAQVFYWLGLLSDVAGNAMEAQGYYRKALYLAPQHPEALAHLGALLASQGDVAGAQRLQERAARSVRSADSELKR